MAWTKRELINAAYAELALAGYEFDLTPDEMQWAKSRMDAMMATAQLQGYQLGYSIGLTPSDGDLDDDSGLPLVATGAVFLKLAIQIAAGKGKSCAVTTTRNSREAWDALDVILAQSQIEQQQFNAGTPLGAGRKPWRTVYQPYVLRPNTDTLQIGADGGLTFNES